MKAENRELFLSPQDLRLCTDKELRDVIKDSKQRINDIRNQSLYGNKIVIEKPHQIKALKKQIARSETILRER